MSIPRHATLAPKGFQIEPKWAEAGAARVSDHLHISILDAITVLLVSTRPDDHVVFAMLMKSLNCALYHASTCAEAARILGRHHITVIVSEQALPDGNWRSVQSAGRFLPAAPELILLSGDHGSYSCAQDVGAQDVLNRPLVETLIPGAIVLGYLRWRRSVRQSAAARIVGSSRCSRPTSFAVYPERANLEHPWP
jgi:hypothetical protein